MPAHRSLSLPEIIDAATLAATMSHAGSPTVDIIEALMAQFGVSRRTAYRMRQDRQFTALVRAVKDSLPPVETAPPEPEQVIEGEWSEVERSVPALDAAAGIEPRRKTPSAEGSDLAAMAAQALARRRPNALDPEGTADMRTAHEKLGLTKALERGERIMQDEADRARELQEANPQHVVTIYGGDGFPDVDPFAGLYSYDSAGHPLTGRKR